MKVKKSPRTQVGEWGNPTAAKATVDRRLICRKNGDACGVA